MTSTRTRARPRRIRIHIPQNQDPIASAPGPRWFARGVPRCAYIRAYILGDVDKRIGTYRVERARLAEALAFAAERGETVTGVLLRALDTYIQECRSAKTGSPPPVAESPVYTPSEAPASYEEAPAKRPCRHPAGSVDPDTSVCGECGADVF